MPFIQTRSGFYASEQFFDDVVDPADGFLSVNEISTEIK